MSMQKSSNNFLYTLLAVLFLLVCVDGGLKGYKELQKKTLAQQAVNNGIDRWKQSFKALAGVTDDFNKKYPASEKIPDIRAIVALIDLKQYGLQAQTDNLRLVKAEPVIEKNVDIGLAKICLGVSGDSLIVNAPSYFALMKGIKELAAREDVYMGSISIQGNLASPQAAIGNFCIFVRN